MHENQKTGALLTRVANPERTNSGSSGEQERRGSIFPPPVISVPVSGKRGRQFETLTWPGHAEPMEIETDAVAFD